MWAARQVKLAKDDADRRIKTAERERKEDAELHLIVKNECIDMREECIEMRAELERAKGREEGASLCPAEGVWVQVYAVVKCVCYTIALLSDIS